MLRKLTLKRASTFESGIQKSSVKLIFAICGLITCCGCESEAPKAQASSKLNILTWEGYLDSDFVSTFASEHGKDVEFDSVDTDDQMRDTIAVSSVSYDVVFPSGFLISDLVNRGLLAPLDKTLIPNLENIDSRFLGLPSDPENKYCVPYSWGTVGLAVNTSKVTDPITSWNALWSDKYRGKITILDEPRSGMVPALRKLGLSINTTDDAEIASAVEQMNDLHSRLKGYTSDRYLEFLKNDDAWIAVGYSGDVLKFAEQNRKIHYIVPSEGGELWVDSMCILKRSQSKKLAHQLINELLKPEIAAKFTERTGFATPNKAGILRLPESIRTNRSIFPPEETLQKSEFLKDLGDAEEKYEARWAKLKSPGRLN